MKNTPIPLIFLLLAMTAQAGGTSSTPTAATLPLLRDFPLYKQAGSTKLHIPAPMSCAAPRKQAGLSAYLKTLTPTAKLTLHERRLAGVGMCLAQVEMKWHNLDTPDGSANARTNAEIQRWYAQMQARGARVEWHSFRDATLNVYGIMYQGRYYFIQQLFEGLDAAITVTEVKHTHESP